VTLTQGIGPISMTLYALLLGERVSAVIRTCRAVMFVAVAVMIFGLIMLTVIGLIISIFYDARQIGTREDLVVVRMMDDAQR